MKHSISPCPIQRSPQTLVRDTLLVLLDGAKYANAIMPWGKPGPIRVPDDPDARAAMIEAHIAGGPVDVLYSPQDGVPELVHVDAFALAAFCPGADGRCRWVGIDLDADDHGVAGLADPVHAVRCLAERADAAGLVSGLMAARSRGGRGRHVFLIPPAPVPLTDGVLAVAALVAAAFKMAAADVADYGAEHAFRCADASVAKPGQAGAVELIPRSTNKPICGWSLALPGAGAFLSRGGGVVVDPFTNTSIELKDIPRCDARPWGNFLADARLRLPLRTPTKACSRTGVEREVHLGSGIDPLNRIDARTRVFLDGQVLEGGRNIAAFAASCNLLGCAVPEKEAERLILAGAAACGLSEREARTAFASAVGARRRRTRR